MEIFRNMLKRKMRTFLTVSGIVIGVFALVVMGSMAEKMNVLFAGGTKYFENTITIGPKGSNFMIPTVFSEDIVNKVRKVEGIKATISSIGLAFEENSKMVNTSIPDMIAGVKVSDIKESNKYLNPDITIKLAKGDWWKDGEKGVAVIGSNLAKKYKVKLGGTITNRGIKFKIVGITDQAMTTADQTMYIPLEDSRNMIMESQPLLKQAKDKNFINYLQAVTLKEEGDEVAEKIKKQFPELEVTAPKDSIEQMNQGSQIFSLMTMGSTLIALVVGGLSVINTMLMSVSERTREIGLKKAIGATNWDIMKEYIIESAALGIIAGIIGLGSGAVLVKLINSITAESGSTIFLLSSRLAIGSLGFAVFIGIFAGLYPAFRAAKLDPIIALKNE